MAEYIEREALLRLYDPQSLHGIPNPDAFNVPFYVVRQNILDVPAADVRPVVRGEWREMDEGYYVCSSCSSFITVNYGYKFCPNCGADMRTEK